MICLLGYTSVGKSKIAEELVKTYGMKNVVSYTTRPMRDYEVDGVDYHFIDKELFEKLDNEGFFAETTSYVMAGNNKVYYGSAIKDLSDDKVMVINPEGFRKIKDVPSLKIHSFLIVATQETIINRLKARGDSEAEWTRRLEADEKDFMGMMYEVNDIITNDSRPIEQVAAQIWDIYTK